MTVLLPDDIKELLNDQTVEWECLELKEGFQPENILHSMCAFANDIHNLGGGHLIVGVQEDSGKPVFPIKGLEVNQLDPYQKKIRELCHHLDPYYAPVVKPYTIDGKIVLLIWAPTGDSRVYKAPLTLGTKGVEKRTYIRQGPNTVLAKREEEIKLAEISAKIKFDSRIHYDASIEAFSMPLIHAYIKETGSSLNEDVVKMSIEELCSSLIIAKGPKDFIRPLNAGLLFFTENPELHFPGAFTDVVIFQDTEGTEFIEKKFIGPLNKQIKDVLEYIKTNVIKEKTRKLPNQAEAKKIINFPYLAIEEAVVNAVYHKSYELDSKVEIRVFPHLIQIVNFPGPVPPVNEKTIQQDRIDVREYRNPKIGKFLSDFKLCEERGTGISTIRKEMKKNGSLPPDFDFGDENTHFMLILKIHPDWGNEMDSVNTDETNYVGLEDLLTENEQIIIEKSKRGSTLEELKSSLNGLSKKELINEIENLIKKKYLNEKKIKKLFGLISFSIYHTTEQGEKVLRSSF